MRFPRPTLFFLALSFASSALGGGFVHSENFTVFTPDGSTNQFAALVLERAEADRQRIAQHWFGRELPASIGRTVINVSFSDTQDSALTWAVDRAERKLHTIYLNTTPERAISGTLTHEIAHAVLATRYPHPQRLPAWLEEAIACQYDDAGRLETRRHVIHWFIETNQWPRLERLLAAHNIAAQDHASYAACTSLAAYLLTKKDKATLLAFGQAGRQTDWPTALRRHYDIDDIEELQTAWQSWLIAQTKTAARR